MTREERIAANEVRFRELNESVQSQRVARGEGRFICECGDRNCMTWLEVDEDSYRAVRSDARKFIVAPGHETPDVEQVVAREPGFLVVEKPPEVDHITAQ